MNYRVCARSLSPWVWSKPSWWASRRPEFSSGFVCREFDCDIARLEEVLIAVEQMMSRLYDTILGSDSLSDWEADERIVTWSVEYETSLLGSSYSTQKEVFVVCKAFNRMWWNAIRRSLGFLR